MQGNICQNHLKPESSMVGAAACKDEYIMKMVVAGCNFDLW
jgi:hypothetical protein